MILHLASSIFLGSTSKLAPPLGWQRKMSGEHWFRAKEAQEAFMSLGCLPDEVIPLSRGAASMDDIVVTPPEK